MDVEASGELETVLDALMKTGVYGASRDKALIACFAKWFDLNRASAGSSSRFWTEGRACCQ